MLKNFFMDESGAELVEYAAAAALLVAVEIASSIIVGHSFLPLLWM